MMAQLGRLRDIQRVNAQDWMGADGSWVGEYSEFLCADSGWQGAGHRMYHLHSFIPHKLLTWAWNPGMPLPVIHLRIHLDTTPPGDWNGRARACQTEAILSRPFLVSSSYSDVLL